MSHNFFVTGATGAQGGYTARSLLAAGHGVHFVARNPSSAAAQALVAAGAKAFPGDFDSVPSMVAAATGCLGAFINVSPVFTDPDGEAKHGANVVAACQEAGIQRVVQSSIPRLEQPLVGVGPNDWMQGYKKNKHAVEKTVKQAGLARWTIIRVPRLLNSYVAPATRFMFPALATDGVIRTAIWPETRQSVIDPADIGAAVALTLAEEGDTHSGKTYEMSQSQMSFQEIVDAMNAALGSEKVRLDLIPKDEVEELAKTNLLVGSEIYLNNNPILVESPYDWGLKLHTAREYFEREKAKLEEALRPE